MASSDRDIAILGVGMHPWGKWGRNFVEYGVHAVRAALADAGIGWRDVQLVAGVIDDLPTVAELIARIMSEAEQTLKRLGELT